jgi:hypothetical protein
MTAPPPTSPGRRGHGPALALAILAVAVLPLPAPADALKFEPSVWNGYFNVSTSRIPNALFMRTSAMSEDGQMTAAPIFPLGGFNVQSFCRNARRDGWLEGDEKNKPGACEYYEQPDGTFSYWQKVPGDALTRTNCYAYALNRADAASWGMPGSSAPDAPPPDPSKFTCKVMGEGVEKDGGRKATRDEVFRAADATPAEGGYYIALFVRPRSGCFFSSCTGDFHFLRRDDGGRWSEKMGATPVVDRDAAGKIIEDPEKADLGGGYTDFCGYYAVDPSKMKMGTMDVPDLIGSGIEKWKEAGLSVSKQPLPYLKGVDDVDPVAQQQERLRAQQRGRRLMMEAAMGRRVGRWRHM